MLRAIWRLFRGIGYLFIGRLDGFSDKVMSNPAAIKGTYNEILREKKDRINEYMSAVGTLVAQREKKLQQVKSLSEESQRLSRLKSGAAAKAKEIAANLKAAGKSTEEIKQDGTFLQCQASFNDFTSTLAEKENRISELESSIHDLSDRIDSHKVNLTNLQREIEKLKSESADAVADIISAKEERDINKVLAGISNDGTAAELERVRGIRDQMKAEAKVSSELAGTDHKKLEAEFEAFAQAHESNAEFDALIGLDVPDDVKINSMEQELASIPDEPELAKE